MNRFHTITAYKGIARRAWRVVVPAAGLIASFAAPASAQKLPSLGDLAGRVTDAARSVLSNNAPSVSAAALGPAASQPVKYRLQVFLHSLVLDGTVLGESGHDEPYFSLTFQQGNGPVSLGIVPPESIGANQTIIYPNGGRLLYTAEFRPGENVTVKSGINMNEDDGDYPWRNLDFVVPDAQKRLNAEISKGGGVKDFTPDELGMLAWYAMPVRNEKLENNDDHLGGHKMAFPSMGPEVSEFMLDMSNGHANTVYHARFLWVRTPLNGDGSPWIPPAANNPNTPGIVVGGEFQPIPNLGFSVRLDRVWYAAPQGSYVTVIATFRNTSNEIKALGSLLKGQLEIANGARLNAVSGSPDFPEPELYPVGAARLDQPIPPGCVATARFKFEVGSETAQRQVRKLVLSTRALGGQSVSLVLPGYGTPPAGPSNPSTPKPPPVGTPTGPATPPTPAPPPTPQPTPAPAPIPAPNNPNDPGKSPEDGNAGTIPPPPTRPGATGTPGDGQFRPLEAFDMRLDEVRLGRGNTLEMFVTYRSASRAKVGVQAGNFNLTVTDQDGAGFRDRGNLYRVSGEPPVAVDATIWLEPGESARVRYIFNIPNGTPSLKKLTVREHASKPVVYDLSSIRLEP